MTATLRLLVILSLVRNTESRCGYTSFYKNCWIRRFPGIYIDVHESERRGAQLLKSYQEETALKCSRTCCLTRNFSCNLAVFHNETVPDSVNCLHLHCPTLESCILRRRRDVILYNVTQGVDPDLLVFGKHFSSSMHVWPDLSSTLNSSEPLTLDKRHFNRPPVPPALSMTSLPPARTTALPQNSSLAFRDSPFTSSSTAYPSKPNVPTAMAPFSSQTTNNFPPKSNDSPPTTTAPARTWPNSLIPGPANLDSGKQYPNDTKGYVGSNHTVEDGQGGSPSPVTSIWHLAANVLLVPLVGCVAALLACCCSVLMAASLRMKRKGRYRTSWRSGRGSMRLLKYVFIKGL